MNIKLLTSLIAVLLILIVILQNTQPVETRFLFITITLPNAALLGFTLLIGIAAGILFALSLSSSKRKSEKQRGCDFRYGALRQTAGHGPTLVTQDNKSPCQAPCRDR